MSNLWKTRSGVKKPMREMTPEELQDALKFAEIRHVKAENAILKESNISNIFMTKAIEIRRVASKRGISLKSLHEIYPGKYEIIKNTYQLLGE